MKKAKQKIYYDKESDVLWLFVKGGLEDEHREISPGINIELDKKGDLLGIEILNASKLLGPKLGLSPTHYPSIAHAIKIKRP